MHHWCLGVPSLPRLCGRIRMCGVGLTSISLAQLCGENHRRIPCAGKSLDGSVSAARDVSHVHITLCPFSVTPFTVLKPLPMLSRLCLFLLPLSCCLLLAHIRPSSAVFTYLILCPSILLKTALPIFFLLLQTLSFFPSPPVIPWISLVLEDMMSSEVFMFVL